MTYTALTGTTSSRYRQPLHDTLSEDIRSHWTGVHNIKPFHAVSTLDPFSSIYTL
jgi:hypothetical protein